MFVKLSVNFICFAWLVHCFDTVELFLATFYWSSSSSFWCAFLLLCWCVLLVFVVFLLLLIMFHYSLAFFSMFYSLSCFDGGHRCPCVTFFWCSPLHLLVFVVAFMLMLIIALMLCFVGVHVHPLLHFVDVCHGLLVAFYWCSLSPPCCIMLVLVNCLLLCSNWC